MKKDPIVEKTGKTAFCVRSATSTLCLKKLSHIVIVHIFTKY